MKAYIVNRKWLADPLSNNDDDLMKSLLGKKIVRTDYYNIKLRKARLDNFYDIYDTFESAKTESDFRFNCEPDEYANPDKYNWWAIYELEIDNNDYVRSVRLISLGGYTS